MSNSQKLNAIAIATLFYLDLTDVCPSRIHGVRLPRNAIIAQNPKFVLTPKHGAAVDRTRHSTHQPHSALLTAANL